MKDKSNPQFSSRFFSPGNPLRQFSSALGAVAGVAAVLLEMVQLVFFRQTS
jgi:hypothetical protein